MMCSTTPYSHHWLFYSPPIFVDVEVAIHGAVELLGVSEGETTAKTRACRGSHYKFKWLEKVYRGHLLAGIWNFCCEYAPIAFGGLHHIRRQEYISTMWMLSDCFYFRTLMTMENGRRLLLH